MYVVSIKTGQVNFVNFLSVSPIAGTNLKFWGAYSVVPPRGHFENYVVVRRNGGNLIRRMVFLPFIPPAAFY